MTRPSAGSREIVWPEGVIFRYMMMYHVQFILLVLAGWINRQQQDVMDCLREENRVLQAGPRGKRLRLSDDDRRRLAVKAKALGRAKTRASRIKPADGIEAAMIPVERKIPEPMTMPTIIMVAPKRPICLTSFGSNIAGDG